MNKSTKKINYYYSKNLRKKLIKKKIPRKQFINHKRKSFVDHTHNIT